MRSFMFIAKIGYDLLPFISFIAKIEHALVSMYQVVTTASSLRV